MVSLQKLTNYLAQTGERRISGELQECGNRGIIISISEKI